MSTVEHPTGRRRPAPLARQQPPLPSRRGTRALPRELRGVRLYDVPGIGSDEGATGVLADPRRGQLVACARVRGGSLALAPAASQEDRLKRWGQLVASFANATSPIRRIGWVSRSIPSDSNLQMDYFEEASNPHAPPHVRDSYLELLERYQATADQREVLVWISTDLPTERDLDERLQLLAGEMRRLRGQLAAARIPVTQILDRVDFGVAIRAGYDPFHRAQLAEYAAGVRRDLGDRIGDMLQIAPEIAPGDLQGHWRHVPCDGCLHRVGWVRHWPTADVGALFALPLLVNPFVVRAVSWVAQLVDPYAALRRANEDAIGAAGEAAELARIKQRASITRRQRWDGVLRREQELAAGYAEIHHAAYVSTTVRGDRLQDLEQAWAITETDAAAARMRLQVLARRQRQGLTLTLPIGRGLR